MGAKFSSIGRKRTTYEVLEHLEGQIKSLNNVRLSNDLRKRKILRLLVLYSIGIYVTMAVFVYFKELHLAIVHRDPLKMIRISLPFLVFPLIIYGVKRIISFWYLMKGKKDELKLKLLIEKKTKLLEEVMEKETYKVAMQILEKFGKAQINKTEETVEKVRNGITSNIGDRDMRRRGVAGKQSESDLNSSLPVTGKTSSKRQTNKFNTTICTDRSPVPASAVERKQLRGAVNKVPTSNSTKQGVHPPQSLSGRDSRPVPAVSLPRPVLPRDRGYLDKFVEFLVGDGPCNRYALICRQCQSHNGMALKEEFLFVAFRCCYCHFWNPARKQRPLAPRLPDRPVSSTASLSSDVSTVSSVFSSHVSTVDSSRYKVLEKEIKNKSVGEVVK